MPFVFDFQNTILLVATLLLFVIEAWAFVDAVSRRAEAFEAANKQNKRMWLWILGIAVVAHMIFWQPIHILNMVGAVASLVYLLDVRPALRMVTRR